VQYSSQPLVLDAQLKLPSNHPLSQCSKPRPEPIAEEETKVESADESVVSKASKSTNIYSTDNS